jgi:hypothetical protein
MADTIEPCTCNPIRVVSSRQDEPGAQVVDVVDEDGRYHAVSVPRKGKPPLIYRLTLMEPSAAFLAAQPPYDMLGAARAAIAEAKFQHQIDLAARRDRGDKLTAAELFELLGLTTDEADTLLKGKVT